MAAAEEDQAPSLTLLPEQFGEGWLSANAADLVRIAVAFGGYPAKETVQRVALASTPGRTTNLRTVEGVLGEMRREGLT